MMTLLWSLWLGATGMTLYMICSTIRQIRDTFRRVSVETFDQSRMMDETNDILATIANAQVDRRNWALEDRMDRGIDDFPLFTPPNDEPKDPNGTVLP